jgi:hypothetical protein
MRPKRFQKIKLLSKEIMFTLTFFLFTNSKQSDKENFDDCSIKNVLKEISNSMRNASETFSVIHNNINKIKSDISDYKK